MARYHKNRASNLPAKKRNVDPMAAYDALPPELRAWLQGAKLPWSAHSCKKIWTSARAKGASPQEALERLNRIEDATLARDSRRTDAAA
ncbi:hypothetical protein TRM7557_02305 [Tritonibacter multivorans]|uniref:Uncharacterized protein n=1 Tax=Tritonibacter multivorans TaxID=928856 RepID=A0A0P1GV33_9RHOB|nr:DUF6525 family protein [Tritonibacter multivorans]MDA7419887.1 DUF6525 family protein [Tritonibacter multivorans]CUH79254.1 hypothetical protein TRM7557_02305 [Tritonibacter multivorans]SFC13090.1 hypothetical protein SAMN04488049_101413 [Tritonibacter multivorans]